MKKIYVIINGPYAPIGEPYDTVLVKITVNKKLEDVLKQKTIDEVLTELAEANDIEDVEELLRFFHRAYQCNTEIIEASVVYLT